ncbi:DUF4332 domain-containing protein [Hyphomonas sp.]|uniref:DUF4332 domain-containing protein n=1 Tax=Hyphomonas sp. TaxID=87 RepID=UPI00391AA494
MTTLLERVIRAHRCRSTHHFIALDALALIGGEEGAAWKSVFLVHHEHLLEGAKAPDAKFKDFKNHVLHVREGEWGGARAKATEWYAKAVDLLARRRWSEAAYALGVLSHYYADPIQPFHTGQTEAENVIHRAVEWSIAKSRPDIDARIAAAGYPQVDVPEGPGFVSDMVRAGAERSNRYYELFIDHYDIDAGVADPPSGLDEPMREAIAGLIAYATAGFAAIISRAVDEAAAAPPKVNLTLQGYIETLDIPLRWITAKLEDMGDRRQVERMYAEFQKTGKVIRTLPEDDKQIRALHAREVRRVPLKVLNAEPIAPIGAARQPAPEAVADETKAAPLIEEVADETPTANLEAGAGTGDAARVFPYTEHREEVVFESEETYQEEAETEQEDAPAPQRARPAHRSCLSWESPVVDAPSIGPKTAKHLSRAGIETVGDLLICDPEETAELVDVRHITVDAIETWQMQATLMIEVPGLRVHDAQLLVGAGITSRADLMSASAATIFELAMEFIQSPDGGRILRPGQVLEEDEVEDWIGMARDAAA